ncbi:hypothetical protein B0T20DRAFT_453974 [Sordaria brevicollis]|uniref:PhoD-like phosphatase domain-containing protein n=1 Tax=Sordaria brevicollis TaxID=83679 RepID=A0AAE0PDH2_SORBR|nr:hypothetical protein B0T20DRAFT_453974 [Sordaria brevicollis]
MSAPYWGQLPPLATVPRSRRMSGDVPPITPTDSRQSFDIHSQTRQRPNRISVQTTKSEAQTDSTLSPFASPTTPSFMGQGLAPPPAPVPYGADSQYPPEFLEKRRRRRSQNQDHVLDYTLDPGPPPPAVPEAPPGPPMNYRYPSAIAEQQNSYSNPSTGSSHMAQDVGYDGFRENQTSVGDRQTPRDTADASTSRRPQRIATGSMRSGNMPPPAGANSHRRRASGVDQPLQRSTRRSSASQPATRQRMFADDRSPLQKLQLTLDSIAKGEPGEGPTPRVEATEGPAQEVAPEDSAFEQTEVNTISPQVPVQMQHVSSAIQRQEPPQQTMPVSSATLTRPDQGTAAVRGPLSQNPPEEGRTYGANSGRVAKTQVSDPRVPMNPAVNSVRTSNLPQRNLSFRERAANQEAKLPSGINEALGPMPTARKVVKKPVAEPWPRQSQEKQEEVEEPVETRNPQPVEKPVERAIKDDRSQQFGNITIGASAEPPRAASQRKADKTLNRAPTQQSQPSSQYSQPPVQQPEQYTAPLQERQNPAQKEQVPQQPPVESPILPVESPEITAGKVPVTSSNNAPPPSHQQQYHQQQQQHHQHHQARRDANLDDQGRDARRDRDDAEPGHHLSNLLYHARDDLEPGQGEFQPTRYLEEWKNGTVGTLGGPLLDLGNASPASDRNTPQFRRRGTGGSARTRRGEAFDGEYDDTYGHPKVGRKGETLYVRPVDHLEEGKDLSRDETDNGLFEKSRSAPDSLPNGIIDPPGSFNARKKRAKVDGEKVGKYKDVRGFRLHAERGYTFWRFNIEVELREKQQRIAYRINRGPATGFWVPAKGQAMNIMFHSCNGFSLSVDPNQFSGPDPMWRDVLNTHQSQPFHVMIGGGDQIYNDKCMRETELFKEWLMIKNPLSKHNTPFSAEMQDELETYYLERYAMWFSQGLFGMAASQIPMVNMYDDHDIIDGFGSYPHHFMNSPVFSGLGNVAFKYYMLFQHQSVVDETEKSEPSWILGCRPGPYIQEVSRSMFMFLGAKVALLAVDARTERTREEVIREDTWKRIMDRCYGEIENGKVEHLLVLLGVPIAYPRLVWLENILTSRLMDPVKALGKAGLFKNLLNHFDGGVEVLDDLDDHWTAKNHKEERAIVIEDLQDLAADKSVRVTILSGDVHLAAIGQFYSNPKLGIPKDKDFRYMPNIISSAIVNTPPPDMLADVLNKRNKVHHFDRDTDEDMIPMFQQGVDGKLRNNKHLLPHRNWCSIRVYTPGSTPDSTPGQSVNDINAYGQQPPAKPGLLRRLSLSKSRSQSGPTYRGPDSVRDRTRPPISNALLRTLSRRGPSVSADQVVPGGVPGSPAGGGKPPGLLKRTLSGSSISGRVGEFFRRRSSVSSQRPRVVDDGGINGTWGAESDDEQAVYDDYAHVSDEYTIPKIRGGGDRGMSAAGVGLRGGGGDYTPPLPGGGGNEFVAGDESYFTAKPVSGGHNRGASAGSGNYPSPPVSGGGGGNAGAGAGRNGMGMFQQSQSRQATSASLPKRGDFAPSRPSPRGGIFRSATTGGGGRAIKRGEVIPQVMTDGALEVTLNVEISPRDPGGSTVPYRLLVPKLSYEYEGEDHNDELDQHEHEPEMNAMVGEEHTLSHGQLQAFLDSRQREDEEREMGMGMGMGGPPEKSSGGGGIRRLLSLKRSGR